MTAFMHRLLVQIIIVYGCCIAITYLERGSHDSYTALCNGVVSHGAPIGGYSGFADHTHGNTNKMHSRSSRAVQRFTIVHLHVQTAVHYAPDESGLF